MIFRDFSVELAQKTKFFKFIFLIFMSSPVEQIKQRLSVADVVQSYIKLEKAGTNFKARCPFHSEKTPSFFVSPSRDIWHCFGCSRGGDIFAFVMEAEGVEFIEALKILADRAGIKLKPEEPRFRNERLRLLELLKDAAYFYKRELENQNEAISYLHNRGLQDSTIQSFLLGYAPQENAGWRNAYNFLIAKGYSDDEIEKSGMAVKTDRPANTEASASKYYDRFRGRIMFPLLDFSGRIIGFSGRIFPEEGKEGVGKYINSPQTILYDKSKFLYGFDRAKLDIRKKDACVLVEGQMDVLMSHQAGVTNTVAVSGTSLTPFHLQIISRLSNNLIVSFDSDEAGLIAAGRGIDLALSQGFEVKVVSIEGGKDPADIASKNSEAWQKAVDGSHHIIDFYLNVLLEKNSDSIILKRKVEQIVLPYLVFLRSEIECSHWVGKIAKILDMREEPIWEQLKKIKLAGLKNKGEPVSSFASVNSKTRRQLLEERLLGVALWRGDANIISEKYHLFFSDKNQPLLKNLHPKGKITEEEKKYRDRLSLENELFYSGMEQPKLEKEIKILENELEREAIKEQLAGLIKDIRRLESIGDEPALKERFNKFNELSKYFNQLPKIKYEA